MKAWTYQKLAQVKEFGADLASWYAGWYEPDGRRKGKAFGPGFRGKKQAEKYCIKVQGELAAGTYQCGKRKPWSEFREEYTARVLEGLAVKTRIAANLSLNHFERIVKPLRVSVLNARHIAEFVTQRRKDRGLRPGDLASPHSINKDLRHIKAVLAVAVEWGYLPSLPKFRMEKAPRRLTTYVTGDHFAAIYRACGAATMPAGQGNVQPSDWWQALMVFGYMSGWRIGDMLALRRDQLDLNAGTAVSLAADNKGKRDERVQLHPVVIEHLRRLPGFTPTVFPWPHDMRTLYVQFARIQEAAGVKLPCSKDHQHSRYCHVYGFHDLRRAFATMNADKLTADALQALMRHKSYQTTQLYINMARQMNEAVAKLHVPEVLRTAAGG